MVKKSKQLELQLKGIQLKEEKTPMATTFGDRRQKAPNHGY